MSKTTIPTGGITADAIDATLIADDAISEEHLDATAITGHTALAEAPADTDEFLISDGGVLKRLDASYIGGDNTPIFAVTRSGDQSISNNSHTVIQWNSEIFDPDNTFDSSTNYRFTAPVAGKYLFLGHLYIYSTYQVEAYIYKNGSVYKRFSGPLGTGGNDNPNGMDFMDIVELSVNDYIEIFGYQSRTGDSNTISIYGGNNKETSFVGYFLG